MTTRRKESDPGPGPVVLLRDQPSQTAMFLIAEDDRVIRKFKRIDADLDQRRVKDLAAARVSRVECPDADDRFVAAYEAARRIDEELWAAEARWDEEQRVRFHRRSLRHIEGLSLEQRAIFLATVILEAVATSRPDVKRLEVVVCFLYGKSAGAVRKALSRAWGEIKDLYGGDDLFDRHQAARFVIPELDAAEWRAGGRLLDAFFESSKAPGLPALCDAYRDLEKAVRSAERDTTSAWDGLVDALAGADVQPIDVATDLVWRGAPLGLDRRAQIQPALDGWPDLLRVDKLGKARRTVTWGAFLARHPFGPAVLDVHARVAAEVALLVQYEEDARTAFDAMHKASSEMDELCRLKNVFRGLVDSLWERRGRNP